MEPTDVPKSRGMLVGAALRFAISVFDELTREPGEEAVSSLYRRRSAAALTMNELVDYLADMHTRLG